jgi:hypothetical protein
MMVEQEMDQEGDANAIMANDVMLEILTTNPE